MSPSSSTKAIARPTDASARNRRERVAEDHPPGALGDLAERHERRGCGACARPERTVALVTTPSREKPLLDAPSPGPASDGGWGESGLSVIWWGLPEAFADRRVRARTSSPFGPSGLACAAREHGRAPTHASVTGGRRKSNGVHKNDTTARADVYKNVTSELSVARQANIARLQNRYIWADSDRIGRRSAFTRTTQRANPWAAVFAAACHVPAHTASNSPRRCLRRRSRRTSLSQRPPTAKGAITVRAHRTLTISVTIALILAAPASAIAAKRLIIGGSTSVLPLAQKLATAYHKAFPSLPAPSVAGGQSDIGIAGRGERPLRHRRLLARSDRRRRSPWPRVHEDRARRRVHNHQPVQPPRQPLPGNGRRHLHRARSATGAKSRGDQITGPIDLFDRDGASGTQDAFQHIFLGE